MPTKQTHRMSHSAELRQDVSLTYVSQARRKTLCLYLSTNFLVILMLELKKVGSDILGYSDEKITNVNMEILSDVSL